MTKEKEQALLSLIQSEWDSLIAALTTLQLSVEKCKSIGIKAQYSFEELESFDSLSSIQKLGKFEFHESEISEAN
jgi:hypothetical protein